MTILTKIRHDETGIIEALERKLSELDDLISKQPKYDTCVGQHQDRDSVKEILGCLKIGRDVYVHPHVVTAWCATRVKFPKQDQQ